MKRKADPLGKWWTLMVAYTLLFWGMGIFQGMLDPNTSVWPVVPFIVASLVAFVMGVHEKRLSYRLRSQGKTRA